MNDLLKPVPQKRGLFTFARHSLSSLLSAGIDYAVFALVYWLSSSVVFSIFCARVSSVSTNYVLEKFFVFDSKRRVIHTLWQYLLLVVVSGAAASLLINWLAPYVGNRVLVAKMLAESTLFFLNFLIQRYIIFKE